MAKLSRQAKLYMLATYLCGAMIVGWQLMHVNPISTSLLVIVCFVAPLLQIFKIEGSTARSSYNLSWIVYGFAFVSMGAPSAILVMLIAHLVEWLRYRYVWYIQTFNMASFAIAMQVTSTAAATLAMIAEPRDLVTILSILVALAAFTLTNHLSIGLVLKLARGQNLAESGVFGAHTLMLDFGLLCLGAAAALLWNVNAYAVSLLVFLAYLLHSALKVPALQRQAEIEPKTGLFNSNYFTERMEQELERANRYDRPLTVVMADLDLLRRVNNTYGHLAGDAVLIGVARILQTSIPDYNVVARFGGEEFAILMPETAPEVAFAEIEEVRRQIEATDFTVNTSAQPIKVTMSFGLASRQAGELTVNTLIHQADVAVYHAKANGRNRTIVFDDQQATTMSMPAAEGSGDAVALLDELALLSNLKRTKEERSREAADDQQADVSQPAALSATPETTALQPVRQPSVTQLYVAGVAILAILLFALQFQPGTAVHWPGLLLFGLVTVLAEVLAIDIYVKDTSVSTSAAPLIAGSLLFGPVGAVILGASVALAAWAKQHSPPHRFVFNASNHIIAGLLSSGIMRLLPTPFPAMTLASQLAIGMAASGIVYLSTTRLVSVAIALTAGQPVRQVWRERFRWLAPSYLALGIIVYALIFSYITAAVLGVLVVLVPLFMLRISQVQYIERTKAMVTEMQKSNEELKAQSAEISLLNDELLLALAHATDLRDPHVLAHSQNVARYAVLTAKEMGLSERQVKSVYKAGLLHDIGKLGIPEEILFKPDKLTPAEYEIIKKHVTIGARLLEEFHALRELIPFIRHHHEYFNGRGYPDRLSGENIPIEARILSLADAVEAMASDRPYRKGMAPAAILAEIQREAGGQFDPLVAAAFQRVVAEKGEGVIVNSARELESRYVQSNLSTAEELIAHGQLLAELQTR